MGLVPKSWGKYLELIQLIRGKLIRVKAHQRIAKLTCISWITMVFVGYNKLLNVSKTKKHLANLNLPMSDISHKP